MEYPEKMRLFTESPQVHIPFRSLRENYLPLVIAENLNPEIGINHVALEETTREGFVEVARRLRDAGRQISIHAPFLDLRPGGLDPAIRRTTRDRLARIFDLVPFFQPVRVVCHPSFDAKYYVGAEHTWLENSIETWRYFERMAQDMDTVISLENVYESDPQHLLLLLDSLDSSRFRFCLDTGHLNCFSRSPLEEWLVHLGRHLGQLHLHDNDGTMDQHRPPGEGIFPFAELFRSLALLNVEPVITLEAHSREHLLRALKNYRAMTEGIATQNVSHPVAARAAKMSNG